MLSSLSFSNKNANSNDFVSIKHKKDLVKNEIEVVEVLNNFFVNAIEIDDRSFFNRSLT